MLSLLSAHRPLFKDTPCLKVWTRPFSVHGWTEPKQAACKDPQTTRKRCFSHTCHNNCHSHFLRRPFQCAAKGRGPCHRDAGPEDLRTVNARPCWELQATTRTRSPQQVPEVFVFGACVPLHRTVPLAPDKPLLPKQCPRQRNRPQSGLVWTGDVR